MNRLLECLISRILSVDIVKVFSLNAIATFVRMLANLISVKIVASLIGPSGIALLGQLNNINSILLGIGNGGINTGIIKYVSEYKEDKHKLRSILSSALKITLICSSVVGIALIILSPLFSRYILLDEKYSYVFIVFGFTIILYELNILLVAIVNGHKQFKKYVVINISSTCVGLIFTIVLVLLWGLSGALISVVSYQSVVFFITSWHCRKLLWFHWENFTLPISKSVIKKFAGYSLMTIVSLSLFPVIQILLRTYVITSISIEEAGWWEGMNRISNMYLSIITTSFGVYYLPRLSEINNVKGLHREIFKCYKFIIPVLILCSVIIYYSRFLIINILFTKDFLPMSQLFLWQLIGDFFKITSWMLAYLMHAKGMTKMFISTELFFSFSYLCFSYLLSTQNGIVGLVQGYMANFIFYMIFMLFVFRKIVLPQRYE